MKRICLLALLLTLALLSGCGNAAKGEMRAVQSSRKTINEILAESQTNETVADTPREGPALDYDAEVDLTKLGSNMVYSTVYNMMNTPDEYLGKTVKASGTLDSSVDPDSGKTYYFCVVSDAAACCAKGLEFHVSDEAGFEKSPPALGTPVTVGGTFTRYEEGGKSYLALFDAEIAC